jgi:hypothetical protein
MSNTNPTQLQIRGKRPKLDPNEPTVTRTISLPVSSWKKLDEIAAKLSQREHCVITSQEVIRRSLKYSMSRVISNVMEGTLLREFDKIFKKYGIEIRDIPKYRKEKE